MKIGAVWITFGNDDKVKNALQASAKSFKKYHPDIPIHHYHSAEGTLLNKCSLVDITPYDLTIFLDADTILLNKIDFPIVMAKKYGMSVCINENPWAKRYINSINTDIREFNTGFIVWNKDSKAQDVMKQWKNFSKVDSKLPFNVNDKKYLMPCNDQCSFALAVETEEYQPFVLPMNWNFRPKFHKSWFGEIKIWHDWDVPTKEFLEHNEKAKLDTNLFVILK